jgi:hypothetical protein
VVLTGEVLSGLALLLRETGLLLVVCLEVRHGVGGGGGRQVGECAVRVCLEVRRGCVGKGGGATLAAQE